MINIRIRKCKKKKEKKKKKKKKRKILHSNYNCLLNIIFNKIKHISIYED